MFDRVPALSHAETEQSVFPGQPIGLVAEMACCASGNLVDTTIHRADQAMYAERTATTKTRGWTIGTTTPVLAPD
jgi:hypothetical protein